ncbi:MAG: malonyl-CoA decarboxylase family protein, partial [Candidatus Competibacterales bacterium]|nr:malonyl-CoA decarboxylase family protein [Candidatus Competibacterales bacterium]
MSISLLQDLLNVLTSREQRARERNGKQAPSTLTQVRDECRRLLASDGEASSISLARSVFELYADLPESQRLAFFRCLREDFGADRKQVDAALARYRQEGTEEALQALFEVCEPPRQELLRRLNLAPGGTTELVRMRTALLALLREDPDLAPVDRDFQHLFGSWFNRGFLVLRRIDWHTSAAVLEKLIEYEAVHEIRDWSDLRRRLDPRDRRCFGFFHPALGDEPLIFVEVALTRDIPARIQDILQGGDELESPDDATTAVFFSISNCQKGLRGISFGNFLLKQVV